jgi:serine/threonine-protein kinase HipA
MDLELAFEVAPLFRVRNAVAAEIVERQRRIVTQWRKIAESLGIAARQQERMSGAFALA